MINQIGTFSSYLTTFFSAFIIGWAVRKLYVWLDREETVTTPSAPFVHLVFVNLCCGDESRFSSEDTVKEPSDDLDKGSPSAHDPNDSANHSKEGK